MENPIATVIGAALVLAVFWFFWRRRSAGTDNAALGTTGRAADQGSTGTTDGDDTDTGGSADTSADTSEAASAGRDTDETDDTNGSDDEGDATTKAAVATIYRCARELGSFYEDSAHPSDLLQHESFETGVRAMVDDIPDVKQVGRFATGANIAIACMAYEALYRRKDAAVFATDAASHAGKSNAWALHFAFKYLARVEVHPVIGRVLFSANDWWPGNAFISESLDQLLDLVDETELEDFRYRLDHSDEDLITLPSAVLARSKSSGAELLRSEIDAWRKSHIDTSKLSAIGSVWQRPSTNGPHAESGANAVIVHDQLRDDAATIVDEIVNNRRSVVVVGESGVGKSALIEHASAQLDAAGWIVFNARASDVLAGQIYIGQLEERLKELIGAIGAGRNVVWIVDSVHEMLYAGRHQYNPMGLLDRVLPSIESHDIVLIGETTPAGYERLAEAKPAFAWSSRVVRVHPLSATETISITRRWLSEVHPDFDVEDRTLSGALQLVRHHLPGVLAQESGLHVFEIPISDSDRFERVSVRVKVGRVEAGPPRHGDAMRAEAEAALDSSDESGTTVVRRYRRAPSPLVRDSVRGWRTGRIDLVLGGDFDLVE